MTDSEFSPRADCAIAASVASLCSVSPHQARAVIALLDQGATIPFISRYRKEATGSLDEVAVSAIAQQVARQRELDKRRISILSTIDAAGKLTPDLLKAINEASSSEVLEDLYLPYKPRRRTRATIAREAGLEPLAAEIKSGRSQNPQRSAARFVKGDIADADAAIAGARDILAEEISEDSTIRAGVRKRMRRSARISASIAKGKEAEAANYLNYDGFVNSLHRTSSHQYLALCRAEKEGALKLSFDYADDCADFVAYHSSRYLHNTACRQIVQDAAVDAYKRLIKPSIENELRAEKKIEADEQAIAVFADNARQLLLAPPLGAKPIIAIDPGFRTGCKLVCLDRSGMLAEHTVIYPTPPRNDIAGASATVKALVKKHACQAIAVGNGTAGRETEAFLRQLDFGRDVSIHSVNENGASIYSASELARLEFPDQDVTVRGAVSIGRRLVDPLAELVKIDPKSIGVGQYQHDVDQKRLRDKLSEVVASCVNHVGVDLNTASAELLTYVSGIGPTLAKAIVAKRAADGPFDSKRELLKVPRFGAKAFEQSAGFLRIASGSNPLDNTAVHPETYPIVNRMARDLKTTVKELIANDELIAKIDPAKYVDSQFGLETITDILAELRRPGRDPRGKAEAPVFDNTLHTIDDLREGMIVDGIVNNITAFGAFVDIGIKQSGLVHISQMSKRRVGSPAEVVRIGQNVKVRIIGVDTERCRISLSMII